MFKPLIKINDAFRYACFDGFLLMSIKKDNRSGVLKKIALPDCSTVLEKQVDTYISLFSVYANSLVLIDADNNGLFFDDCLSEIARVSSPLKVSESGVLSDFLVVFQGKIKEREYGIYSKQNKEILWLDKEQNSLECFGDYLFGQNSFEIHRSEINTGKILWKTDFKSIFPVLADKRGRVIFLSIHNELLICGIDSLDKLLAININDGSIKWERTTLPNYYQYDTQKKVLHVITAAYKSIDPNTGNELDSFNNRDYFDEIGIFSQRGNYAISGDYLITTDHSKGIIGVFNTVTHKFDWVHKEEGVNFPGANPIMYDEPYLFAHDNKGTLHIFEKE